MKFNNYMQIIAFKKIIFKKQLTFIMIFLNQTQKMQMFVNSLFYAIKSLIILTRFKKFLMLNQNQNI